MCFDNVEFLFVILNGVWNLAKSLVHGSQVVICCFFSFFIIENFHYPETLLKIAEGFAILVQGIALGSQDVVGHAFSFCVSNLLTDFNGFHEAFFELFFLPKCVICTTQTAVQYSLLLLLICCFAGFYGF